MATAITWFRKDLRLADNPAVAGALSDTASVAWLPIYIHAPEEEGEWAPGAASQWWLHHSLTALAEAVAARGGRLHVFRGRALPVLLRLCEAHDVTALHWNRRYEPEVVQRDRKIKDALLARGIRATSHNGSLLHEPWDILTGSGDPYRVFTPYWRKARASLTLRPRLPSPRRVPPAPAAVGTVAIDDLDLLPSIPWDAAFSDFWTPGEAGALRRMRQFVGSGLGRYRRGRDVPGDDATSRLSPHLHHGDIAPWRAAEMALTAGHGDRHEDEAEAFVRELGWREFSYALLYHFPASATQPLNAKFAAFSSRRSASDLTAWQRGETGIPIVDAGMRQLWRVGWMHNRVRMLVASLLTKNLRVHWLEGARWFWDTLVDADLPNNTQGWQWTAGSGADAAPYFRIFNPVLQGRKFDPQGSYVKRWVPELERLPDRWVHEPSAAPDAVLTEAGLVIGRDYPAPIVDLKNSRGAALAAYKAL